MDDTRTCPNCAKVVNGMDSECPACGIKFTLSTADITAEDIEDITIIAPCPGCHAKVTSEDPHCPHCGFLFKPLADYMRKQLMGKLLGHGEIKLE